jgi:hypothetical protein
MKKAACAARDIALNMFEGWDSYEIHAILCLEDLVKIDCSKGERCRNRLFQRFARIVLQAADCMS